jgi:hypothetical protein
MDCPSGSDDRPFNVATSVSDVSSPVSLREMSAIPCNQLLLYAHKVQSHRTAEMLFLESLAGVMPIFRHLD